MQQCMLKVWYGNRLVDMKAMIMASCIDLYRHPVCKRTNCVVADMLRPAFTILTTCVRSTDRFSMPRRHRLLAWLCLTGIVLGAGTRPEARSIQENDTVQYCSAEPRRSLRRALGFARLWSTPVARRHLIGAPGFGHCGSRISIGRKMSEV